MARRGHPRKGRNTADWSAQQVAVAQRDREAAERDARDARLRAAEAETLLRELVRAIDTAPLSIPVPATARQKIARHPSADMLLKAPHADWPPLSRALVDVKRFLDGHRRG